MSSELASPDYMGDLGDGLIRRWSTVADTEKFALLMGTVHRGASDELPNPAPMAEMRLIMRPDFPYMTANDVAVVEDTSKPDRPLVACTCLWRHTWSYAGIPFGVGRPEMVATHPEYRKRGLVRSIFEMIHARSAAEGHLLQGITGIYYFYRQFGYDYVLDLEGSRTTYFSSIPEKKGDGPEPCSLRHATLDDVPLIVAMYNRRRASSLVWHEAPGDLWRFHIEAWNDPAVRDQDPRRTGIRGRYWMILDAEQTVCGYAWVATRRWGRSLHIADMGLAPQASLPALAHALLRAWRDQGVQTPAVKPDAPPCSEISFDLGRAHPMYDVLGEALAPRIEPPYAWYIRIPDLAAFLRRIAPVLEARLAHSILAGYSGSPKIDLYRDALRLSFEQGKLTSIESLPGPIDEEDEERTLGCPPLTFPQLLLGYRGLDELRTIFPDVWAIDDKRLLIDTLFPKQPSTVEPLG